MQHIIQTMSKECTVVENKEAKYVSSPDYNYAFNKHTGYFLRWGKTKKDDPQFSPFGNEILDIEITTKCSGPGGKLCPWCYKSNTPSGINMSFDTFKAVLDKMLESNKVLTQIAFGSDAQATSNPDLFKMMEYCRSVDIVPNITVADITDETADKLVSLCGAVAVSRYDDKHICYDSVKRLTDRGLKQTNIHQLICRETLANVYETIQDIKTDDRLKGLNAIVFLSLKQKGRGKTFTPLTQEEFSDLVNTALKENIRWGMDSCSACKCLKAVKDHSQYKQFEQCVEPCESGCFSLYIDVNANVLPCSFAQDAEGWNTGINILDCKDFVKGIWHHPRLVEFRNKIIANGRNCFLYNV